MAFDPASLALWFVAFLLSATCHEAAHALVARIGGDRTAAEAGQVTLNPLPHIKREPLGMVVVPLVVFIYSALRTGQGWMVGWASAPFDPDWAERHPRRAGLMAAAGPAANIVLAALGVLGLRLMVGLDLAAAPASPDLDQLIEPLAADPLLLGTCRFLSIMAGLNLLLGFLNMLPLPPLDGAAVLAAFGGERVRRGLRAFQSLPMAGLLGLFVAFYVISEVGHWLVWLVLAVVHPGVTYSFG